MSSCMFRTGDHANLDVDTDLPNMSVVVPARFVVQIWAPKREKCGGLREYDDG